MGRPTRPQKVSNVLEELTQSEHGAGRPDRAGSRERRTCGRAPGVGRTREQDRARPPGIPQAAGATTLALWPSQGKGLLSTQPLEIDPVPPSPGLVPPPPASQHGPHGRQHDYASLVAAQGCLALGRYRPPRMRPPGQLWRGSGALTRVHRGRARTHLPAPAEKAEQRGYPRTRAPERRLWS